MSIASEDVPICGRRYVGLRASLIAGFVALSACGATVAPVSVETPSLPPLPHSDTCGAAPHAGLIGQPPTALERVYILRQVRLIRPDTAVTEDFRPDRINFHIEPLPPNPVPTAPRERIFAISCG